MKFIDYVVEYDPDKEAPDYSFEGNLMEYLESVPKTIQTIADLIHYLEKEGSEAKQEYLQGLRDEDDLHRTYSNY